ncbi:MAG: hypothetical protein WCH39_16520, partial [Schlesneria sp.]
ECKCRKMSSGLYAHSMLGLDHSLARRASHGTAADCAAALASVTYQNLKKTPNRLTRTVTFSTTDNQNVSNTVARTISFI